MLQQPVHLYVQLFNVSVQLYVQLFTFCKVRNGIKQLFNVISQIGAFVLYKTCCAGKSQGRHADPCCKIHFRSKLLENFLDGIVAKGGGEKRFAMLQAQQQSGSSRGVTAPATSDHVTVSDLRRELQVQHNLATGESNSTADMYQEKLLAS